MSWPLGILVDSWNGLDLAHSHRTHSSFSSQLPVSNSLRYAYFQKKEKTENLFYTLVTRISCILVRRFLDQGVVGCLLAPGLSACEDSSHLTRFLSLRKTVPS